MHRPLPAPRGGLHRLRDPAADPLSRGAKRKRTPSRSAGAAHPASPRSTSSAGDETAMDDTPWDNTSSDTSTDVHPPPAGPVKRRARTTPLARRARTPGRARWSARSERGVHPTPLRTWRQRVRMQTRASPCDSSSDTPDAAPDGTASPRAPARGAPAFLRSPHSRRLRRHESPRAPMPTTPRPVRPARRRMRYTGLERRFRGVGLLPNQGRARGPSQSDLDAWDDASDLSSPRSASSSASSADASASPVPSRWAGAPRRMRTRSVSQSVASDMDVEGRAPTDAPSVPSARAEEAAAVGPAPGPTPGPAPPSAHADELFTHQALLRRRRPSLVALCEARHIPVHAHSTKPMLVESLLTSQIALQTAEGTGEAVPPPKAVPDPAHQAEPPAPAGEDEVHQVDLEQLELHDHEIPPEKLEKLEKIGSGAFKDVYVGRYHLSRTRVTKVAISDLRNQLTDMDIKELQFLRDLRHENIVRFIGVSVPTPPHPVPIMIVSELCSNGDLFDYIRNTPAPPDVELFALLLQIARGLDYLHTRTPMVIHRDCKSTNVLITKDRVAKISDFGFARAKRSHRVLVRSIVGTVNWQAPELWVPKPNYNEKADVWSAAMTFWEALQWHNPEKRYPFQGMNEHQIYLNVGQKQQRPFVGTMRRRFGNEIVELLDRMWAQLPRDRPSMSEVCAALEQCIALKRAAAAPGPPPR
ncbi:non-specific serine/threonine protein kinase [Malassezia brasiliensis]|uniref:Non-specific serine/threonine protein kinase n=1 Tax=Malassezia brasiliensis TaxID=1821822 RepID=A0AAF0DVS2_9BASI|nr:non-specific serine/threonine protein kinase [Malassezia brasiliensis]